MTTEGTVQRLVRVPAKEYDLFQKLAAGVGFSGYALQALREKAVKDLESQKILRSAISKR